MSTYNYVYTDVNNVERDVLIHYDFTPGRPAKLNGPPEDCFELEGASVEITFLENPQTGDEIREDEIHLDWDDVIDKIIVRHEEESYDRG